MSFEQGSLVNTHEIFFDKNSLHKYVIKDLDSLKNEINFDNWISKSETISLLEKFKNSYFTGKNGWPEKSAQAIFAIQLGLKFHWLFEWKIIDGIYWNIETQPAINMFQRKWNTENSDDLIQVDGIPWPQTIQRLITSLREDKLVNIKRPNSMLFPVEIRASMPQDVIDFIWNNFDKIINSSISKPLVTDSGRQYIRFWNEIYYSKNIKSKNMVWEKINEKWDYTLFKNKFIVLKNQLS